MTARSIGIAFVGFGRAARTWQAPVYRSLGLRVVGAYDVSRDAALELHATHPGATLYDSLEALLSDDRVDVVDLATRPPGRMPLLERILVASKHVLVQKPVARDVDSIRSAVRLADELGLRVAVNVNGRWAPAWWQATRLVREGAVGALQSITHVYDTRLAFTPNPALQGTDQFLLFDYTTHWVDITQHWAAEHAIAGVQARVERVPVQPSGGERLETMWLAVDFGNGLNALVRGAAAAISRTGHPFWIHGSGGTIRGDVDAAGGDWIQLETDRGVERFPLSGEWFPDGFGGAMSELLGAVVDGREPSNSLRDHLRTAGILAAACESARRGGAAVAIDP